MSDSKNVRWKVIFIAMPIKRGRLDAEAYSKAMTKALNNLTRWGYTIVNEATFKYGTRYVAHKLRVVEPVGAPMRGILGELLASQQPGVVKPQTAFIYNYLRQALMNTNTRSVPALVDLMRPQMEIVLKQVSAIDLRVAGEEFEFQAKIHEEHHNEDDKTTHDPDCNVVAFFQAAALVCKEGARSQMS